VFVRLVEELDNEYAMIRSAIVRAHQPSAGAKGGTKHRKPSDAARGPDHENPRHLRRAGQPDRVHLTRGQAHDLAGADVLLPGMEADTVSADKAFDADDRVSQPLQRAGTTIVILSKARRTLTCAYDADRYTARHLIENVFVRLKHFRAIATRSDKRAVNFLGAI
jgi:transposase